MPWNENILKSCILQKEKINFINIKILVIGFTIEGLQQNSIHSTNANYHANVKTVWAPNASVNKFKIIIMILQRWGLSNKQPRITFLETVTHKRNVLASQLFKEWILLSNIIKMINHFKLISICHWIALYALVVFIEWIAPWTIWATKACSAIYWRKTLPAWTSARESLRIMEAASNPSVTTAGWFGCTLTFSTV